MTDQEGREGGCSGENLYEKNTKLSLENKKFFFFQRNAAPISLKIRNPGKRHWDVLLTMNRLSITLIHMSESIAISLLAECFHDTLT